MKHIYWLTGLPCSGKTTIANAIAEHLYAEVLDGDVIRSIAGNTDFSVRGRTHHMKSVAYTAALLSKHTEVVVALVSPLRAVREELKILYPNLYEIYLKCAPKICRKRDVKGMYVKALKGEIRHFTGLHQKYEEPLHPHLTIETDKNSVHECIKKILTLHDYTPKALLIGRWQPLHEGHKWLVKQIQKKGQRPLIGIRHTPINDSNPYTVQERIEKIHETFGDGVDHIVVPDIVGVYWGRNVGYEVRELNPPEHISAMSGTKIRNKKT